MLIALFVGAACAFSVANALAKRGAHGKASMIILARHVDALRAMDSDAVCTGPDARAHQEQIAFAAREIEFAFTDLHRDSPTFKRRADGFRTVAGQPPATSGCAGLDQYLGSLDEGCKACHQEFRG
jgi:hypothetical protein